MSFGEQFSNEARLLPEGWDKRALLDYELCKRGINAIKPRSIAAADQHLEAFRDAVRDEITKVSNWYQCICEELNDEMKPLSSLLSAECPDQNAFGSNEREQLKHVCHSIDCLRRCNALNWIAVRSLVHKYYKYVSPDVIPAEVLHATALNELDRALVSTCKLVLLDEHFYKNVPLVDLTKTASQLCGHLGELGEQLRSQHLNPCTSERGLKSPLPASAATRTRSAQTGAATDAPEGFLPGVSKETEPVLYSFDYQF